MLIEEIFDIGSLKINYYKEQKHRHRRTAVWARLRVSLPSHSFKNTNVYNVFFL
jgi:hypothetical protein